jgi:hypothetical protein
MELLCLGKVTDRDWIGTNNRLFLEAVLWTARTGSCMSPCKNGQLTRQF